MSLEIQDEFASRYAKYSHNKDNWQILPVSINHVVQDWWSNFGLENPKAFVDEYYQNPKSERVVREIFSLFFTALQTRNHVHVPEDVQEAAIQEYIED